MITFGKKTYLWTRKWNRITDDVGSWLVFCAISEKAKMHPTPKINGKINLQVKTG